MFAAIGCVHRSGTDCIDSDMLFGMVARHGSDEPNDTVLGGVIGRLVRLPNEA